MENSYKFFANKECQYFPCHEAYRNSKGDFNCLFCYCPMYLIEKCPGNPNFIDKGEKRIKDCSNCTFPHRPENYDKVMAVLREKVF